MREEGAAGHVANRGVTSKADKIELAGEVSRLRSGLYIRDRPTDLPCESGAHQCSWPVRFFWTLLVDTRVTYLDILIFFIFLITAFYFA